MAALTSQIFTITLTATSLTKLVEEAEKFVHEAKSPVETIVTPAKDAVSTEDDPFALSPEPVLFDKLARIEEPVKAPEPKANNLPKCAHGEMKHRSGTSKAGKPYDGFYCTAKDFADQCPPVFPSHLKKKQATLPADQTVDWKNENNQL